MILSLILFGSRARGDHRSSSDVDLLAIVDTGKIRQEVSHNGISLFHYPISYLREKSENGDLFLLHITKEGKILHDTAKVFQSICERFNFKISYQPEIVDGSAIIWFLLENRYLLLNNLFRKKLIWAIRTILIAKSAEKRDAIFSSAALAVFSHNEQVKNVIDNLYEVDTSCLIKVSRYVVKKFGASKEEIGWPSEKSQQKARLRNLGGVPKSTIEIMDNNFNYNLKNLIYNQNSYL